MEAYDARVCFRTSRKTRGYYCTKIISLTKIDYYILRGISKQKWPYQGPNVTNAFYSHRRRRQTSAAWKYISRFFWNIFTDVMQKDTLRLMFHKSHLSWPNSRTSALLLVLIVRLSCENFQQIFCGVCHYTTMTIGTFATFISKVSFHTSFCNLGEVFFIKKHAGKTSSLRPYQFWERRERVCELFRRVFLIGSQPIWPRPVGH